jgi:fucose permease
MPNTLRKEATADAKAYDFPSPTMSALKDSTNTDDSLQHDIYTPTFKKITCISSILTIMVAGLALFSDGYNAQIIGYMQPLFADLYAGTISKSIKTRLSNAYLIGEIFGMLFFGYLIDKIGRRTGVVLATFFLILGIIIATAARGKTEFGMFWMMIVGRGIAGFGAGGGRSPEGSSKVRKTMLTR